MTLLASLLMAIPAVVLSNEHQAMVKTGVGQPMPELRLFDAAGKSQPIATLRGEKATVVAVLGGPQWMTQTLRDDLGREVAKRFNDRGVRVVEVSLGVASKGSEGVAAVRVDRGEATTALGAGRLPRLYLLDGAGKIVWLDIEYSESSRRELIASLDELTAAE